MTEEQKEDIKLLKELIADTSIPNDDREIYQEALNQILAETKSDMPKSEEAKSDMPKVEKVKMPKKEKVTRKTKASPKTKAEKPTALPSDVEEMKKAIKERTGKTEAECEDIIAQYRKLRAKAKVNSAKRTEKLKSDDKLITGTNVITPVAQIEKDAEIVKAKIEKQVEQIENKAEREVVKKDKTKDEVKVEVDKKVVKQLSKLSDDMVTSATTFVKNIQTELKKVDKTEAKNFLLGLRNEIDALLSKFGDGGSTIETYNITENESASSVNPSLFARGGGVKSNNNDVRVKALIKNLDNTPYSIGLAILRERLLTYTENDLRAIEKNPDSFNNPIISRGMYKDYFNRVIEELKFDYEDGGSVDDGDFAKGGGVGNPSKKEMLDYLNMYFDNYSELRTIAIEEDNILTRRMLNSLDNEELEMAYDDAKYEMKAETQYARGGSSDKLYIFKVYNLNDKLVDKSRRIFARNLSEAKEIAILIEDEMHLKYGRDLRFKIEEAPLMMANGGSVDDGDFEDGGSVDDGDFANGGGIMADGRIILRTFNGIGMSKDKTYNVIKDDRDSDGKPYYTLMEKETGKVFAQGDSFEEINHYANLFSGKNIDYARGGGVRIGSDGREYPFGSAWALEHNKKNKSEKYEIPISSRKS